MSLSCRPKDCDSEEPLSLQVLISAEHANPGSSGEPWPTELVLLEFERPPKPETLRFSDVIGSEEDNLGLVDALHVHRLTAFPRKPEVWTVDIDPKTEQLLTVARFQKQVGDGWFDIVRVPQHHQERVCEANRKRESLPNPCLYLLLEDFEILGGAFPPAGLDRTQFDVECAPLVKSARIEMEKQHG